MSNKQNDILDEMKRETIEETPLGELFYIVADIAGRLPTEKELRILHTFLLKSSLDVIDKCKKTIDQITLDKAD